MCSQRGGAVLRNAVHPWVEQCQQAHSTVSPRKYSSVLKNYLKIIIRINEMIEKNLRRESVLATPQPHCFFCYEPCETDIWYTFYNNTSVIFQVQAHYTRGLKSTHNLDYFELIKHR